MSMPQMAADAGDTASRIAANVELQPTRRRRWIVAAKILVSIWLVFHIAAIIIAPASVSPSSLLVQSLWRGVRPYLQTLYLNHGYHYFAPEPSASTLIGYTADLPDGTTVSGRIPHRGIEPRLLYHRHFMLTEYLAFAPAELRPQLYQAYARQIGIDHGAKSVSLSKITHFLPVREAAINGVKLDDPASYSEEPLGTFPCAE